MPFPVYPGLHVQLYDPSVLLQKAFEAHLWTLVVHSLISKRRGKKGYCYVTRNRWVAEFDMKFCMTGHGRLYTSHHKSVRGILYLKRRDSEFLFIQHQALIDKRYCGKPWARTLSLDWLTDRSRSEGRVESILSILDFTDAVFKAWCCLFNSSVEFSPATMNMNCN